MIDSLLLPFEFDFMINAMVIAVIVAVPMALLSCFVVLKGWSLMGDAISHAVFPGVVIAYMAGLPFGIGAFVAGMLCAIITGFLKDNSRIKQDTVMGVVFAGMFGLGLVLYVKVQSEVHLDQVLFGDALGVSLGDIIRAGLIAAFTALVIGLKWRDFLLYAFDPAQARTVGLRVGLLHYGLLALISLTIVGALQAVGIILAIAMLIAPGAIAFLLSRRFSTMMIIALIVAMTSSFVGIYLSFFLDSAPAPTIVLVQTGLFIAAFVASTARTSAAERKRVAAGDAQTVP